ncbi:hypothetical protein Desgi_2517 [Desulfoscipio gibsoniae DSM 7213]|uniref:Uncharacterized protein n=1 Tax=Desulfoscipio gibsoniae DSM 7213 TaxID=767817 RepID=R4KH36_9FIRM|nr:hypothetical protein Desgi_2517 [Desulfoscipio gibsoniae DSM 7213]
MQSVVIIPLFNVFLVMAFLVIFSVIIDFVLQRLFSLLKQRYCGSQSIEVESTFEKALL